MVDSYQKAGRKRTANKHGSGSSKQTSRFIPFTDFLSVNFGYSVSVIQCVVLTVCLADHCKQLACGLRALTNGDIDRLAGLAWWVN
jgi:hypothetical protein